MRIPLDYYRILGLPIQASVEQLQQAYRDSTLQLPRREYSGSAIAARKQLLEEAYAVLSDPEQRTRYDASYFARAYQRQDQKSLDSIEESAPIPAESELNTPSIEISDDLFVGALLILQELGEYELVLNLGCPYLSTSRSTLEIGQRSEPNQALSDIVLTVTLAYLELGREQWQQGQYKNAATSLKNAQALLLHERLFPSIDSEIQADLNKLRPYLILELLARADDNVAQRSQGLKLLQDILQQRGGIDGTSDDGSGLSLDDFLLFIQQLRSYLTAAEQQSLFEAESQRPSAVATYLLVYALIARGFAQSQPALIRQAKLLLTRLGKRQDLYLEQAVCSLLLGQTEAASHALEHSHEYETLAFIRENSQGAPDLLPGLCLYSERWLQTEVFPHFQDLVQQQASLKDYFADEQVQAYLETLPMEVEANNQMVASVSQFDTNVVEQPARSAARSLHPSYSTADVVKSTTSSAVATRTVTATDNGTILPAAERLQVRATAKQNQNAPNTTALAQVQLQPRSRRRTGSWVSRWLGGNKTRERQKTRLVLPVAGGLLSMVILVFVASQTYGWFKQTFLRPSLPEQPTKVVQPPPPIPDTSSKPQIAETLLTPEAAEQVIRSWFSAKAAAFGSNHAIDRLNQILVDPALSQWQQLVQKDKVSNRYRQFKHSLKLNSAQTSQATPDQAQVEATVNEVAQIYEDNQINRNLSYGDNLRIRYDLVRQNGEWRIRDMTLLK